MSEIIENTKPIVVPANDCVINGDLRLQ